MTARGDWSGAACHHLRAVLEDLIDGQGNLSLAVDLGDVTAIDAAGARALAWAASRMDARQGVFRLSRPSRSVMDSLRGAVSPEA